MEFLVLILTPASAHGSGPFRYKDLLVSSCGTELTSIQYSLVFLPGLLAGRLCDLGCYKRTLLTSRSVT